MRLRPLPDSFYRGMPLTSSSRKCESLAGSSKVWPTYEREKMSDDAGPRVRFCDEYENLMDEFVRALSAWTQLRCFQEDPPPSNIPSHQFPAKLAPGNLPKVELARCCGSYIAAMWALRMHSRTCLLCQETLRVQVNGDAAPPARLSPSCC
jgi:hypothetical protein